MMSANHLFLIGETEIFVIFVTSGSIIQSEQTCFSFYCLKLFIAIESKFNIDFYYADTFAI